MRRAGAPGDSDHRRRRSLLLLAQMGDLLCIDLKTGKTKWAVKTLANNDNIMWAMSGSPLVYENMVIVNPGAPEGLGQGQGRLCIQSLRNGERLIWGSGDTRAGYSSPMLATLAGKLQVVQFDADCIAGFDLKDGKRLWKFDWPIGNGVNVAQPVGPRARIVLFYLHQLCTQPPSARVEGHLR